MTSPDPVADGLATLAKSILDEARSADVGLDMRLDAFKAVTAYYVGVKKVNGKTDGSDDSEGAASFDQFRQRIASSAGGR
jgi:hypothetical protein